MRKIQNCFLLLLLFPSFIVAQVYVNGSASGNNDGTSWSDAFTDLTEAIHSTSPGDEIWVAAGTYLPGGTEPSRDTSFTLPHDLKLYGGFAGTESVLAERDIESNKTLLSGDYAGDDADDNYMDNKTDNAIHVMFIQELITNESLIDGFTFSYGFTEGEMSSGNLRRGGGILTYGAPTIRNCTFTQNWGWFGGGLYPRGTESPAILIENCTFMSNRGGNGSGVYVNKPTNEFRYCLFIDNISENSGGGLYNNSQTSSVVDSCQFINNVSLDGRGGGIYLSSSPMFMSNSELLGNRAGTSTGGGMHTTIGSSGLPNRVTVIDTKINEGLATWGGAVTAYQVGNELRLINCEVSSNEVFNNGGAVMAGFGATVSLTGCDMQNNIAARGGVINIQNDTTKVSVTNCDILFNAATLNGGVANVTTDDTIGMFLKSELIVKDAFLAFNNCVEQGGAINLLNGNLDVENSLFVSNQNNATGAGGALSINAFDTIDNSARIVNSTFYGNVAEIGACIGHFTDDTAESVLDLQNNIFARSSGLNYQVEGGSPVVASGGGNLSDDNSLMGIADGLRDSHLEDPLVRDPGLGFFDLQEGSPAIDMGVAEGAPELDKEGNARIGEVDKGCFEFLGDVAVEDLDVSLKQLKVFPNPIVNETLDYNLKNDWNGKVKMTLKDINGQSILVDSISKNTENYKGRIQVGDLEEGVYLFNMKTGNQSVTRTFIKL